MNVELTAKVPTTATLRSIGVEVAGKTVITKGTFERESKRETREARRES